MRLVWATAVGLVAVACGSPHSLVVDLRTDLMPEREFDAVQVRVTDLNGADWAERVLPADPSRSYIERTRIAEWMGLADGDWTVTVSLLKDEVVVLSRPVRVALMESLAVTVVLTRDCVGVACPTDDLTATACQGGVCVDPTCSPETPARCPAPECDAERPCAPGPTCALERCVEGVCLYEADDAACGADVCDPDVGCVSARVPPPVVDPTCVAGLYSNTQAVLTSFAPLASGGVAFGGIGAGAVMLGIMRVQLTGRGLFYGTLDSDCDTTSLLSIDSAGDDEGLWVGATNDDVYASGQVTGAATFGETAVPLASGHHGFVAGFNAARPASASVYSFMVDFASARGVAVAQDASIGLAGVFRANFTVGDSALVGPPRLGPPSHGYVVRFGTFTTPTWVRQIGGASGVTVNVTGTAFDAEGNLLVVGSFTGGTLEVEGMSRPLIGRIDLFIASYAPDGTLRFLRTAGGPLTAAALAVVADPTGDFFVAGFAQDGTDLGLGPIDLGSPAGWFVARHGPDGTPRWVTWGLGGALVSRLALDPEGNLYAAGQATTPITVEGEAIPAARDILLFSLRSDGSLRWVRHFAGPASERAAALVVDGVDRFLVGGDFSGPSLALDDTTLTADGTNVQTGWIARFVPGGT